MVFGPSGRDHDSPNEFYLNLGTPRYFKKYRRNTKSFWGSIILGGIKILETMHFFGGGKYGGRKIMEIRFICF